MPAQPTLTTSASMRDIPVVASNVVYEALPPRMPHAIYTMPLSKKPATEHRPT